MTTPNSAPQGMTPGSPAAGLDLDAEQKAWYAWYMDEAETFLGTRACSWKSWKARAALSTPSPVTAAPAQAPAGLEGADGERLVRWATASRLMAMGREVFAAEAKRRGYVRAPVEGAPGAGLLKRAEAHLTKWLDMADCDCENGHYCGRTEVERTRDDIRAALSTPSPVTATPAQAPATGLADQLFQTVMDFILPAGHPMAEYEAKKKAAMDAAAKLCKMATPAQAPAAGPTAKQIEDAMEILGRFVQPYGGGATYRQGQDAHNIIRDALAALSTPVVKESLTAAADSSMDGDILLRLAGDLARAEKQFRECMPTQGYAALEILRLAGDRLRDFIDRAAPVPASTDAGVDLTKEIEAVRSYIARSKLYYLEHGKANRERILEMAEWGLSRIQHYTRLASPSSPEIPDNCPGEGAVRHTNIARSPRCDCGRRMGMGADKKWFCIYCTGKEGSGSPTAHRAEAAEIRELDAGMPLWATGQFTQEAVFYNMLMAWSPDQCKKFYAMLSRRPDFNPEAGQPGKGYRLLTVDDIVEADDEVWAYGKGSWAPVNDWTVGKSFIKGYNPMRRRLEASEAKPGEAKAEPEQSSPVTPKFPVSQAPDCLRCGDTKVIGYSRGYDGEASEIECPDCKPAQVPEGGARPFIMPSGHKWWCAKENGGVTCGCGAPEITGEKGADHGN